VRCTLDVVSVQVGRWCEVGTVRGVDFVCYGKEYQFALSILEFVKFFLSASIFSVRLIYQFVLLV